MRTGIGTDTGMTIDTGETVVTIAIARIAERIVTEIVGMTIVLGAVAVEEIEVKVANGDDVADRTKADIVIGLAREKTIRAIESLALSEIYRLRLSRNCRI